MDRETILHELIITGDQDSLLVAQDLAIELNCGLPARIGRSYGRARTGWWHCTRAVKYKYYTGIKEIKHSRAGYLNQVRESKV